jgi:hypothetical protein
VLGGKVNASGLLFSALEDYAPNEWVLSSSSDPVALSVVDGTGRHAGRGPHYSRRTPGAKTFTGCGAEIVLVTADENAVWACVYQWTPARAGSGTTRGRTGTPDTNRRRIFRNNMFRNLGPFLSSDLIRSALVRTREEWTIRYGGWPEERLRTEIEVSAVKSRNPGYCYKVAGWEKDRTVRGKLYLWAPPLSEASRLRAPAQEAYAVLTEVADCGSTLYTPDGLLPRVDSAKARLAGALETKVPA